MATFVCLFALFIENLYVASAKNLPKNETQFNENKICNFGLLNSDTWFDSYVPIIGHASVILFDENKNSVYFSFGPANHYSPYGESKIMITYFDTYDTQNFLYNGNFKRMLTSVKNVAPELGYKMYLKEIEIYEKKPDYSLLTYNCDCATCDILAAGGQGYSLDVAPDFSYENLRDSAYGKANLREVLLR
jgi:hypothetical protein